MPEQPITHSTFVIEHSYPKPPETVFLAWSDPARKHRWFANSKGLEAGEFTMDFRVGGTERSGYRMMGGPLPDGTPLENHSVYQDIEPDRRIVLAYTMSVGGQRISASLLTVEFQTEDRGTRLVLTEQGAFFPNADGPVLREQGQRKLLEKLAVELAR